MGGGVIHNAPASNESIDEKATAFNKKLNEALEQADSSQLPKGEFQYMGDSEQDGQWTVSAAYKPEKGWGTQFNLCPTKDGKKLYDQVKEGLTERFKDQGVSWTEDPAGFPSSKTNDDIVVCGGFVPEAEAGAILSNQTVYWVQKAGHEGEWFVMIYSSDGNAKDYADAVYGVVGKLGYYHPSQ